MEGGRDIQFFRYFGGHFITGRQKAAGYMIWKL